MYTTQELQQIKAQLKEHINQIIDLRFDQMIAHLGDASETTENVIECERTYLLNTELAIFKGKKIIRVLFTNGQTIDTPKWKSAVSAIMQDCISDPSRYEKLMALRGKIQGRDRVLLGSESGTMHRPLKIAENLYLETHYDSETLLRILTARILSAVSYDYSGIRITVRNG